MSLQDRFDRYVGRSGSYRNADIERTEGNYLVSGDGDRYVDFIAGWCVVNAGYGRTDIVDAAAEATKQAAYVKPSYMNEAVTDLAERLAEMTPGTLSHTFRLTSGTEAVVAAVKAARSYTGGSTVIANEDAYHGSAYGPMEMGDVDESYGPFLPDIVKVPSPARMDHDEWIAEFEAMCEEHDVAAYITEPVLTHQGVHVPHDGHYRDLKRVCEEHGVLLVFDEVANGFGRTGKMFGTDHFDVGPDIMTFAKGFSSGYAPIAAMITTQDIGQHVSDTGGTYSTFGWTPEAVAAAQKNIDILEDEDLPTQAERTGEMLADELRQIDAVQDVRQTGLLIGVAFEDDIAKAVRQAGVEHGVMTGTTNIDNVLLLSPPLNIDREYIEEGVDRLADAIQHAL